MDRRLFGGKAGAEVGAPSAAAGTHSGGELLAMRIGVGQSTEVGTIAGPRRRFLRTFPGLAAAT
jgi:hypothetical protein